MINLSRARQKSKSFFSPSSLFPFLSRCSLVYRVDRNAALKIRAESIFVFLYLIIIRRESICFASIDAGDGNFFVVVAHERWLV
jgi:hypothetical protein